MELTARAGITHQFQNDFSSAWELSEAGLCYLHIFLFVFRDNPGQESPSPRQRSVWEMRTAVGPVSHKGLLRRLSRRTQPLLRGVINGHH